MAWKWPFILLWHSFRRSMMDPIQKWPSRPFTNWNNRSRTLGVPTYCNLIDDVWISNPPNNLILVKCTDLPSRLYQCIAPTGLVFITNSKSLPWLEFRFIKLPPLKRSQLRGKVTTQLVDIQFYFVVNTVWLLPRQKLMADLSLLSTSNGLI